MRELQLIVPGLAAWRDSPHSEPVPMPGLQRILARGKWHAGEASLANALCLAFGIPHQQDSPLAPITARHDGINTDVGYWLRADPVHLQIHMRGTSLLDAYQVGLGAEESSALASSLMPLFRDAGWHLLAPTATRWYAHPAHALNLHTTPLDEAASRHINSALPTGPDAPQVMRLINDTQIILHAHPVNKAREARGLAPINSLWLWGGGLLAKPARGFQHVLADQVEALALARFTASPHAPGPARLADVPRAASSLVVLHEFPADADATAARRLDTDWFQPLLQALRLGHVRHVTLTLTGPEGGCVRLSWTDAWRFWRKDA